MKRYFLFALFVLLTVGRMTAGDEMKTETRKVSSFTGINTTSVFVVDISKGPQNVEIVAPEKIMASITTEVDDHELVIDLQNYDCKNGKIDGPILVHITMPELKSIHVCGSAVVKTRSDFESTEMRIEASGASLVNASIAAPKMEIEVSGSAHVDHRFPGSAVKGESLDISSSGASFLSTDASASALSINACGSAYVKQTGLFADAEKLDVSATGATSVTVSQSAKSIGLETVGSSKITLKKNETKSDRADISMTGASNIDAFIQTAALQAEIGGSTKLTLAGSADMSTIHLHQVSMLKSGDFVQTKCCIETTGSSHAEINVTEALQAEASSASAIDYTGNPARKTTLSQDSARIDQRDTLK